MHQPKYFKKLYFKKSFKKLCNGLSIVSRSHPKHDGRSLTNQKFVQNCKKQHGCSGATILLVIVLPFLAAIMRNDVLYLPYVRAC